LSDEEIAKLNSKIDGATITRAEFIPEEIPGVALNPKHEGVQSFGIRIQVDDYEAYQPFEYGLIILSALMQNTPGASTNSFIYRLAGSREIDDIVSGAVVPENVEFDLNGFMDVRSQYLMY
jgi:uncharacterized protein YbbC (DUF1343 family)